MGAARPYFGLLLAIIYYYHRADVERDIGLAEKLLKESADGGFDNTKTALLPFHT